MSPILNGPISAARKAENIALASPSIQGRRQEGGFASELKFTVGQALAAEIRRWAQEHMAADPHGSGPAGDAYTIHSLYLDTKNFDVLRRNGSFGRAKYRIRLYGSSDAVFLERKMKRDGLVSKKRTEVALTDLGKVADLRPDRRWNAFWYHRRILARGLQPVCQIRYSRIARVAASGNGAIRLTLDHAISLGRADGFLFHSHLEPAPFSQDRVILELKFRKLLPALFQQLIQEFHLVPNPVSKYRMAGSILGLAADVKWERAENASGEELRPGGELLCSNS